MSSLTSSQATTFERFTQDFAEYVSKETGTVSLKNFHASFPLFFISNSSGIKDLRSAWNLSFSKAVRNLNIESYSKEQPDWDAITKELANSNAKGKKAASASASASTSSTRSTRSTASSPRNIFKTSYLSLDDWDSFERKYRAMENTKKWEVEPGVFVEDKIYDYAKTIQYENAAHSFILNLADPHWKDVFTTSQLKAIEEFSVTPLAKLPSNMSTFFDKFKGVNDLDELYEIADNTKFHYVNEFDACWSKRSILDVLTAYRFNVIKKIARYGKERDVIMRVWRAIDTAMDDLDVDISRRDQLSAASSDRGDEDWVDRNGEVKHKLLGVKPDMIVAKDMLEFASSEHGLYDEAGIGSKESVEKLLKLPKTMKYMLLMLHNEMGNKEDHLRALRVIGFSHTHLRMNAYIMDSPAGYVCRIKPTKEQKIPMTLTSFHETYIPFLTQVYKLKHVIKEAIKVVTSHRDDDDAEDMSGFVSVTSRDEKVLVLPSVLNVTTPMNPKKRKAEPADAE